MDFNGTTEKWMKSPLLGLPLRMVFVGAWHRIHFGMISAGGIVWLLGFWFEFEWIRLAGVVLAAPSAACVAVLLPVLGIVSVALEGLLQDRKEDSGKPKRKRAPQSGTGRAD